MLPTEKLVCAVAAAICCVGCGESNSVLPMPGATPSNQSATPSATAATAPLIAAAPVQPPTAAIQDAAAPPTKQHPLEKFNRLQKFSFSAIKISTMPDDGKFQALAQLVGHQSAITRICASPDAEHALTCERSGQLIYWNLAEGKSLWKNSVSENGPPRDLAISPDGKVALAIDGKGRLLKWDAHDGKQVGVLSPKNSGFEELEYTGDPNTALLIDGEQQLLFVDVAEMRLVDDDVRLAGAAQRRNSKPSPLILQVSPDSKSIHTARGDSIASQFLRTSGGAFPNGSREPFRVRAGTMKSSKPRSGQQIVAFVLTSNNHALTAYADGLVDYRAVPDPGAPFAGKRAGARAEHDEFYGRPTSIREVALLPGGEIVASYGGGESIDYWSVRPLASVGRHAGDVSRVTAASICPDGRHAISGWDDGRLIYYRLPSPQDKAPGRTNELRDSLVSARESGNFDQLESIGDEIRKAGRFSSIGSPEYSVYFSCVTLPNDETEASWLRLFRQLEAWAAAKPNSTLALIALANAHLDYGWRARGTGYAGQVTADGQALFQDHLSKAGGYLLQCEKLDEDDPAMHSMVIRTGQGLSMGKELLQEAFETGVKSDPNYWPLYSSMATCLLPRWYGERGDLAEFFQQIEKSKPGDEGLALYAYTTAALKNVHSSANELRLLGIDLDKASDGSKILVERFPHSNWILNFAGWIACVQRDRDSARDLFGWLGPEGADRSIWVSDANFRRARDWALSDRQADEQTSSMLASLAILTSLAYSPDGQSIAVGGVEPLRQVTIWDVASGDLRATLPHRHRVLGLEYSPNGKSLATAGGADGQPQLWMWDLTQKEDGAPRELEGPLSTVTGLQFTPDGKRLVAGSDDGAVWIWDLANIAAKPARFEFGGAIDTLDLSDDGTHLVVGGVQTIKVYEMSSGKVVHSINLSQGYVSAVVFLGDELLVGTRPFQLFRAPIGESKATPFALAASVGLGGVLKSIAPAPNGKLIACGLNYLRNDDTMLPSDIVVLNSETNREVIRFPGQLQDLEMLRFSPDGSQLAGVGRDGTLRTWRLPDTPMKTHSE